MDREAFRTLLESSFERLRAGSLQPVEVAVVDSGIDSGHPDLVGRLASAWRVSTDPGDARVVAVPIPSQADQFGHGTGVAGIITSIAPNAVIVDINVLSSDNTSSGPVLLAGVRFAVERGFRLINLSLAATHRSAGPLNELCERAYRQNQIVVAARRNMPLVDNGFPAEFSSCIAVDAAQFSSPFVIQYRADHPVEYVAHGNGVRTAAPGGRHKMLTGTSFATPTITGLCALLVGAHPDLRPFEVKTILKYFAADYPPPTAPDRR